MVVAVGRARGRGGRQSIARHSTAHRTRTKPPSYCSCNGTHEPAAAVDTVAPAVTRGGVVVVGAAAVVVSGVGTVALVVVVGAAVAAARLTKQPAPAAPACGEQQQALPCGRPRPRPNATPCHYYCARTAAAPRGKARAGASTSHTAPTSTDIPGMLCPHHGPAALRHTALAPRLWRCNHDAGAAVTLAVMRAGPLSNRLGAAEPATSAPTKSEAHCEPVKARARALKRRSVPYEWWSIRFCWLLRTRTPNVRALAACGEANKTKENYPR